MVNRKVKKIVTPFSIEEWNRCQNHIVTSEAEMPVFIQTHFYYYQDGKRNKGFIGLIQPLDTDAEIPCWWNADGEAMVENLKGACDLKLVREEVETYDYITEKDVPDTDDFKQNYERFCKYFRLDKVEYLRYKEFLNDHKNCPTGSTYLKISSGAGLGTCIDCGCSACNQEIGISNIDAW